MNGTVAKAAAAASLITLAAWSAVPNGVAPSEAKVPRPQSGMQVQNWGGQPGSAGNAGSGGLVAAASSVAAASGAVLAFPGAEGYAKFITGGRGGKVCQVTNLNNSGAGSLRACVAATGRRTIVFRTSGTITLDAPLPILAGNVTIAGQTAPPPGIELRMKPTSKGQPLYVKGAAAANVIVRHLKFRPTSPGKNVAMSDCFTIENSNSVYLDHVSCSYAYDEGLNGHQDVSLVTISNSIIGPNIDPHSKGSLWCSDPISACGRITDRLNLYFSNRDRNPNLQGRGGADYPFDAINNYYYNPQSAFAEIWCSYSGGIATNGTYANFVGNVFRRGPATIQNRFAFRFNPDSAGTACTPQVWQSGNDIGAGILLTDDPRFFAAGPVSTLSAPVRSPTDATTWIQARVGAFWWARDALDARIVADAFNGKGPAAIIKSPAGYLSLPALITKKGPTDTDGDGMSNEWESANGFNPGLAEHNGDADADGYTNLEEYLAARAEGDQR